MDIELSALEERAEAREHMAEALRILNAAIRRTRRAGLSVRVEVLTMYSREGTLPQLEPAPWTGNTGRSDDPR
ncbi:hypothetical protein LZK73_32540 (plasmid) [Neorhizobium galegae]|nr:hypothetical protein LZK73_32540 [Neorhizobium galegae]